MSVVIVRRQVIDSQFADSQRYARSRPASMMRFENDMCALLAWGRRRDLLGGPSSVHHRRPIEEADLRCDLAGEKTHLVVVASKHLMPSPRQVRTMLSTSADQLVGSSAEVDIVPAARPGVHSKRADFLIATRCADRRRGESGYSFAFSWRPMLFSRVKASLPRAAISVARPKHGTGARITFPHGQCAGRGEAFGNTMPKSRRKRVRSMPESGHDDRTCPRRISARPRWFRGR